MMNNEVFEFLSKLRRSLVPTNEVIGTARYP